MYHTHTIAHVPPLHISDTRYVSDFPSSFIRHTLFIRSPTTIYQTHAPFRALHSYHYLHAFGARVLFWDHPYSRLINAKATTNDHDPTIYVISLTVSMVIEPTALINTKATNNDRDPTTYVISITVSMGIEPTAPHTGSTQLYATGASLIFWTP